MPRGDVETYHQDNKWHNCINGEPQPFSQHFTRGDARLTGREEAVRRKVDHIMRNLVGHVSEHDSYRDGSEAAELQLQRPLTQASLDPQARRILSEVNEEMRGQPAGEILWTLIARMQSATRQASPNLPLLAAFAAAIHEDTFRG
jgi:hypothetical protein